MSWIFWLPGATVRFCATRELSAEIWSAAFGSVGDVVTAARTATDSISERMASSFARIPYCTVTEGSTRTVEVARAEPAPASPVYHCTVFAAVPFTAAVAVASVAGGVTSTRCGG